MTRLQDTTGDDWKALADEYEKLTSEVASRPISTMLERANELLPFSEATGILDNGCGPGPVMLRLLRDYNIPESCTLVCSDFSDAMVDKVKAVKDREVQKNSASPWSRVETIVQNAMDLQSVQDSSKSHVTAGWVYFMTPEPQKCLSESRRVLVDGGVLSCSSWEGSQWLDLMNLLPRIRPDKAMPELPKEWMNVDAMKGELEKGGFRDVESFRVNTTMKFERMEELVDFMLTKMPHMIHLTKDFSTDDFQKLKDLSVQEGNKMCSSEPGELSGVALIAVGRK